MEKPEVYSYFMNIKGNLFDNIREISFTKDSLCAGFGKLMNETIKNDIFFDTDFNLENGVYIYQDNYKKDIGYRIYKEFADYKFNGYRDDILISKLQDHQKDISLTDFPTGVVTKDRYIIGQEIKFYQNAKTVFEYSHNHNISLDIYLGIYNALKEMYENGIAYLDGHPKNFMVLKDKRIKPIDFDKDYIHFDPNNEDLIRIVRIYKQLINILNRKKLLDESNYKDITSFEQLKEAIIDIDKQKRMSK